MVPMSPLCLCTLVWAQRRPFFGLQCFTFILSIVCQSWVVFKPLSQPWWRLWLHTMLITDRVDEPWLHCESGLSSYEVHKNWKLYSYCRLCTKSCGHETVIMLQCHHLWPAYSSHTPQKQSCYVASKVFGDYANFMNALLEKIHLILE